MLFNERFRRLASTFLLVGSCVFGAQLAHADTVVLDDGRRVDGQLANREHYLAGSIPFDIVAIYIRGESGVESRLERFDIGDVDYIVVSDGDEDRVLDPLTRSRRATGPFVPTRFDPDPDSRASGSSLNAEGVVLVLLGLGALAVGIFDKFGGPEVTITETEISGEEETYSNANYALMIAGVALTAGGLIALNRPSEDRPALGSQPRSPQFSFAFVFEF